MKKKMRERWILISSYVEYCKNNVSVKYVVINFKWNNGKKILFYFNREL